MSWFKGFGVVGLGWRAQGVKFKGWIYCVGFRVQGLRSFVSARRRSMLWILGGYCRIGRPRTPNSCKSTSQGTEVEDVAKSKTYLLAVHPLHSTGIRKRTGRE